VIPHRISCYRVNDDEDEDDAAQPALLSPNNHANDHEEQDTITGSHSFDSEDEAKKVQSNTTSAVSTTSNNLKPHSSRCRHIILTSCILIFSYILAISVTKLDLVLSLVGATGSTIISFILPGLLYLRITQPRNNQSSTKLDTTITARAPSYLRWMAGALTIYGVCVLCICVSFTLKKAIYH
jgi:hypothetical protein